MKNLPLLLSALLLTIFTSCKKELIGSGNVITLQRETGNFNALVNEGSMKIVFTRAEANRVQLTGEDNVLEKVKTRVSNGKLYISYSEDIGTHKHKEVSVIVMTPGITAIEQNGSGSIQSPDQWVVAQLTAFVNGSGNIEVVSTNEVFNGTVNGSGTLRISGTGKVSHLKVKGSGKIKAFTFLNQDALNTIEGSGYIEVDASASVHATISGSGKVYHKGNPVVTSNISGSGKVIRSE